MWWFRRMRLWPNLPLWAVDPCAVGEVVVGVEEEEVGVVVEEEGLHQEVVAIMAASKNPILPRHNNNGEPCGILESDHLHKHLHLANS